jgi:hypothetical protein
MDIPVSAILASSQHGELEVGELALAASAAAIMKNAELYKLSSKCFVCETFGTAWSPTLVLESRHPKVRSQRLVGPQKKAQARAISTSGGPSA